jgi:hypothetical protein
MIPVLGRLFKNDAPSTSPVDSSSTPPRPVLTEDDHAREIKAYFNQTASTIATFKDALFLFTNRIKTPETKLEVFGTVIYAKTSTHETRQALYRSLPEDLQKQVETAFIGSIRQTFSDPDALSDDEVHIGVVNFSLIPAPIDQLKAYAVVIKARNATPQITERFFHALPEELKSEYQRLLLMACENSDEPEVTSIKGRHAIQTLEELISKQS